MVVSCQRVRGEVELVAFVSLSVLFGFVFWLFGFGWGVPGLVGLAGLVGLVGVRRLVKSPRFLLGFLPRRVLLEPQKVVLRPALPLVLPLPGLNHEVRRVAVPRVRLPTARVRPRVVPLVLRVPGRRPVRLVEPLGRRNGLRGRVVQVPVLRS